MLKISELKDSSGHMIKFFPPQNPECYSTRYGIIDMLKKNGIRNVIHVGCCGHPYYIKRRIEEGKWLHKLLIDAFDNVIGIDINEEAVDIVRSFNIKGIYCMDMLNDYQQIYEIMKKMENFKTAIILPEVLEHINNPINFLSELKKLYGGV